MAKKELPNFKSSEEFDEWVEKHDTSEYHFEDAPEVKVRYKKKPITLKVYPTLLEEIKIIATKQKIPYQSLINQWLVEKVTESKKF